MQKTASLNGKAYATAVDPELKHPTNAGGPGVSDIQKAMNGRFCRAIALAIATTFTPLPVMAADSTTAARPGPIRASIERIAVKHTAVKDTAHNPLRRGEARKAKQSTQGQDRSFFKTRPGILALAVVIAGAGYAIYSTQDDRIKSPGRE